MRKGGPAAPFHRQGPQAWDSGTSGWSDFCAEDGSSRDGQAAGRSGEPQISVVTAASAEDVRFLDTIWDSIQVQRDAAWEWVIQEDGPTSAWRLVESYGSVSYANCLQANGVAIARNLAVARSRASIIRNLDADDQLTEGVLRFTADIFDAHPEVAYLVGPMIDLFEDGSMKPYEEVLSPGLIPPGTLFRLWLERDYVSAVHPTSLAVRRDALTSMGGYTALPCSEDTAVLMALSQITPGWFADRPVAVHRKRTGSITTLDWSLDPDQRALRYKLITERCHAIGRTWSISGRS